jgi:CSLREA domain-containing protein
MGRSRVFWGRLRAGIPVLLALLLAAGGSVAQRAPLAHGASFSVNTTADLVDDHPGDGVCRTSAGTCSLRAAIMEADAEGLACGCRSVPISAINLQAGQTYALTVTTGKSAVLSSGGALNIAVPMRITGSNTIIRGGTGTGTWSDHIFLVDVSDVGGGTVEMTGLTIEGGQATNTAAEFIVGVAGGGIYLNSGGNVEETTHLSLSNCVVANNIAVLGGGIYAAEAQLTLDHSSVSGNRTVPDATAGGNFDSGGGIFVDFSSATIKNNSTVIANASDQDGGGIFVGSGSSSLTLSDSTVRDNAAGRNGGGLADDSSVTMTNSTVTDNIAGGTGGGVYVLGDSQLLPDATATLTANTISGNTATGDGGGLSNGGTLTLTGSTLSGNTASGQSGGGGLFNAGTMTLTNDTISGNTAGGGGGGIKDGNNATATLNNVTVASNKAANGGGTFKVAGISQVGSGTPGSITLQNSIVAANTASTNPDCSGIFNSQGHNLVGNKSGCILGDPGGHNPDGDLFNQDARLGPLQSQPGDAPGTPQTQALLGAQIFCAVLGSCTVLFPPSAAIDTGTFQGPGEFPFTCAVKDERLVTRPIDGNGDGTATCDMGAYEAPKGTSLGTFSLTPKDATAQVGKHLSYTFAWTVPSGGWRSLESLNLLLRDDDGTALWLRFHEVAGSASTLSLIDPKDLKEGPNFSFGSPNRLENDMATVYLATSSLDGPQGSATVTLSLDLGFKPKAAGRDFDVAVMAIDDSGKYEGLVTAGTLTVAPR